MTRIVGVTAASLAITAVVLAPAAAADRAPDPNLVAARAAAGRLLTVQRVPEPARSVPRDPSVAHRITGHATAAPGENGGFVVRWRFFRVPASAGAVNRFLRHHRPAGYRRLRSGAERGVTSRAYTFPSARNRLTVRELVVWTAPAHGGATAIGLESRVLLRPSWEQVGTGVTGARVRLEGHRSRTIGRSAARRLAHYVDGVGVLVPGWYGCAGATTPAWVRFIGSPVRLRVARGGCGFVSVWVGGRPAPVLTAPRLYGMVRRAYVAAG